jgi:hypothetical protein
MKILLGDFNVKVGKEDIFEPTSASESLHKISNDNGVVNFTRFKNLTAKSTMFPYCNINKCTWMSPDGKTHNQIERILVDRRKHSDVLDVRSCRAANCDTDHSLVVARVRGRLEVNKQSSHGFHIERFNLKKLNEVEGKEKCCIEVSNRFAALEDLDTEGEINSAWEKIRKNIKISAKESIGHYELRKHKPWFDKGCSQLLDQRKQSKLQWSQDPSEIKGDNLNSVRREGNRHFRDKNKEYMKGRTNELAMNNKDKNIRDLNEFNRGTKREVT